MAFAYNSIIAHVPSRTIRAAYLRLWLKAYGRGTGVQRGVKILQGRKILLAERVVINFGCLLDGRRYEIHVGPDTSIGPEASILTLGHDPQSPEFADKGGPVRIGARVWIGYRAILMPGITVGEGAVIAAGSVVTRDVQPFEIVAGAPARVVGERNRALTYRLSFHPWLL